MQLPQWEIHFPFQTHTVFHSWSVIACFCMGLITMNIMGCVVRLIPECEKCQKCSLRTANFNCLLCAVNSLLLLPALQIPHIATTAKPRSSIISFVWNTLEVCPWENIRIKGNKLSCFEPFSNLYNFYNSQKSVYFNITTLEQIIV